ncbi:MAG TPA: ABC transporter permease [Opitutaceae bacterium]|jgi:lipopolysaccharide transport system permease protein|nr:ABC transporter permease [Opitutaceae bacterium]
MTDPRRGPSPVAGFARKRDLWWQFTVRAIEMRHRGSYLGMLWSVLNPLLMLSLYMFVFGVIFKSKFGVLPQETPVDVALTIFLGLILYHVIAETLAVGPTIIVSTPNLVKKVVFPLEVLPLAQLGAFWFHLLISLGLLLIGMVVMGRSLTLAGLLWLPAVLLPQLLLTAGLCWFLAALGVFFRDINQVIQFASQIMLWASAIFYPISRFRGSPVVWNLLKWNPLLQTVQLARDALLWHQPVNLTHLTYTYAAGLATFIAGGWFFRKMQPAFADVI